VVGTGKTLWQRKQNPEPIEFHKLALRIDKIGWGNLVRIAAGMQLAREHATVIDAHLQPIAN